MPNPYTMAPGYQGSWSSYPPQMNTPQPPYPMPQFNTRQQQQPINNILRFTGPESAKAFSMPPNSDVIGFDGNAPVFYMLSTDDAGFKTMKTFDFQERLPEQSAYAYQSGPAQPQNQQYAMKDDLDEVKKQISEMANTLKEMSDAVKELM